MTTDETSTRGGHSGADVGLDPGMRFRCEGCGNLTRFDVTVAERAVRYWHVAVSGEGTVEDTDVTEQHIDSVTCRWCGPTGSIVVEEAPVAGLERPA